ncbi:MAG: hypothetical protein PVH00_05260 [Gemmatimonadota bacterium]|jgi:hypothetical protein
MTQSRNPDEEGRSAGASLKIAYAVAKQRVQDLHFHGVMELIDRARGEVAAPQALAIFARLHHLSEAEAQALKNRVMVHMGRASNADIHHLPNTFVAIDGAVEWDVSASLVDRIRKRVGGRRRHALREWVELHTGHVESQLLRLHVECLRNVREAAGASARLSDLTRDYAREMGVSDTLRGALHHGLAEQLFAELPGTEEATPAEGESRAARSASGGGGDATIRPLKFRQA